VRISRIYIKNFRSIEEIELFPTHMLCLIGENNAGKSNVLKALNFILGDSYPIEISKEDIYQENDELEVVIEIDFDLSQDEREEINKLRSSYSDGEITSIKFHKLSKRHYSAKRSENHTLRLKTTSQKENRKYEFLATEIFNLLGLTYIGANRDISKHLGYVHKWTLMSKLANRFEKELDYLQKEAETQSKIGLKDRLKTKFEEIEELFSEVEKFKKFDSSLKSYFIEHLPQGASEARYDISVSFRAYNPLTYFKSLNIIPEDEGREVDLNQLGDGFKTLLLLSYFKAYAEAFRNSSVIIIEEPEIYLHPHLRRHIYTLFKDLTKNGIQIFYSTHSPDLVDIEELETIGLVKKGDDKSIVTIIDKDYLESRVVDYVKLIDETKAQAITFESIKQRLFHFFRPEQKDSFFAQKIVLVEGQSELYSLQIYAESLGLSFDKHGISILDVGGKDALIYFYILLKECLGFDVYVIFDYDSNINCAINKALAQYLQIKNIDSTDNIITSEITVFKKDYEAFIKSQFNNDNEYTTLEQNAREIFGGKKGSGKWFIQKYIAQKVKEKGLLLNDEYFNDVKKILSQIFSKGESLAHAH
jgi:putative ATP-dependent endonuclease of OLD family